MFDSLADHGLGKDILILHLLTTADMFGMLGVVWRQVLFVIVVEVRLLRGIPCIMRVESYPEVGLNMLYNS